MITTIEEINMGLMESANSLMGHTIYEQRVLEKQAKLSEGFEANLDTDEEVETEGLDSIIDMERAGPENKDVGGGDTEGLEGLEGGDEEGEEEEIEMISVEDAIRAIQMVIDGEAETAEEAIEMVKGGDEEGGDTEGLEGLEDLEGGEEEIEVEVEEKVKPKFDFKKKNIQEEDDEDVEGCSTAKADQYGESHSTFLQFAERYLK